MSSEQTPPPEGATPREYDGERDMARFWDAARVPVEPSKQRWYVPLTIILVVFSVPWYYEAGHMGKIVAGFPIWIWTALLCSLGVACLTALAILRFWKDDTTK